MPGGGGSRVKQVLIIAVGVFKTTSWVLVIIIPKDRYLTYQYACKHIFQLSCIGIHNLC